MAGRKVERANPAAVAGHAAQDGAEQNGDAGLADRFLDPARQRDLVVHDDGGVRRPAAPVVQRLLRAEVAQDIVGNAMGELAPMGAVGEQSAEGADDRVDRLATERRQPVQQRDLPAEAGGFEGGRDAGNAGAQHADIGRQMPRPTVGRALDDPGRRRDLRRVRAHRRRMVGGTAGSRYRRLAGG
jgi:hypothetical protein